MRWRLIVTGGVALAVAVSVVAAWLSVTLVREPLSARASRWLAWPVACTTRGCITVQTWREQLRLKRTFAEAAREAEPSSSEALASVLRQHMLHYAQLRSPVTLADARRYRQEVLNLADENVTQVMGMPAEDYDRLVVLPFLEQESLKQQRGIAATEELYAKLAQERPVLMLLWRWRWDKEKGEVVER